MINAVNMNNNKQIPDVNSSYGGFRNEKENLSGWQQHDSQPTENSNQKPKKTDVFLPLSK